MFQLIAILVAMVFTIFAFMGVVAYYYKDKIKDLQKKHLEEVLTTRSDNYTRGWTDAVKFERDRAALETKIPNPTPILLKAEKEALGIS